ncbi:hypothetical protein HY498_05210 [Candidatus Woesearchaeota archaeon]|nr:hypothetical protein [Candidatus Woesearchaeota archaeon]
MKTILRAETCILPLKQLVLEKLNSKQKIVLGRVKRSEGVSVSAFVLCLKEELQCTDSALWKTIKSLRELNLLDDSSNIKLTETGKFLVMED